MFTHLFALLSAPPAFYVCCLFLFLAGLCIGSFLNVCIWRIPREESIVFPGSHCPSCNAAIAPYDNLPLLSWLILGGKCRACRAPISPRYFIVELLTAALFTLVFLQHGFTWLTPVYLFFTGALIFAAFVDFDHFILPDRVTIGGMVLGPVLSFILPALHGTEMRFQAVLLSLGGMALGFGILWLVAVGGKAILKRDAMGFGDVKLLGAIGACLGWRAVLFCILISSLSGTLTGLALMLAGKKNMQSRIPYGPHIALAAALWMLYGPAWVQTYLLWAGGGMLK